MSQLKDVVVRLKALDGVWEVGGVDRKRGITPVNMVLTANAWGPDTATFDLRRDPKAVWPDLGAFTDVDIEIGGVLVWDGQIKGTPSRDGADAMISVQGKGWQYHLDDDPYETFYVHTNVGDWRDVRTFLTANLATYVAVPQVSADRGIVTLAWPKGQTVTNNKSVGVALDLGPAGQKAKRIIVEWDSVNNGNHGSQTFALAAYDEASGIGGTHTNSGSAVLPNGLGSSTMRVTLGGSRYIGLQLFNSGVPDFTAVDDIVVRIKAIRVFAETAYESGDLSQLKASTVITDGLARGTLLLSADQSGITVPSFSIPDFRPQGPRTTRENWQAVNAFHDYVSQIAVGRRPIFAPKPTAPIFDVGAWSPMEAQDTEQNSGDQIYSTVLVTGQTPQGDRYSVQRAQGIAPTRNLYHYATIGTGAGGSFSMTSAKPFKKGVTYALRVSQIVVTAFVSAGAFTAGKMGAGTGAVPWAAGDIVAYPDIPITANGTFGPFGWVLWTPAADTSFFGYSATGSGSASVSITFEAWWGNTLVERRGFRRTKELPIRAPLPADGVAAAQIGDTWLTAHRSTPFKGPIKLTGDDAIRHTLGGHPLPLERLLLHTQERVHFSDRVDPDTGNHGRDGRIANVRVDVDKNEAVADIDETSQQFEALLERLAVVTGAA